jgi:hypothetical protein
LDYYDRFRPHFGEVDIYRSSDFPEEFQTWSWDDRSDYPDQFCPYRLPMFGERHPDAMPVCIK